MEQALITLIRKRESGGMYMKKLITIMLAISLILSLTACGQKEGEYDSKWALNQISSNLNKSIEKGVNIKKMQLITEISKDTMYPEDSVSQILSNYEAKEAKSEENTNLDFGYRAFYSDGTTKEVESKTNYKGFYLNVFYPCSEYNKIELKNIDYVQIKKDGKYTIYKVFYDKQHYSRRYEWEYSKVLSDYELFKVDENGYITDYSAVTKWKKAGDKHESNLRVKVVSYEPF